jgi:dipeptidase E
MRKVNLNTVTGQIVAIGGALTKSQTAGPLLFKYIFGLTGKEHPKVLFINTATGDKETTAAWSFRTVSRLGCLPSELTFFDRTPLPEAMRELVLSQDVILVGGGNTKSMLAVWHAYGLPALLREAWQKGIILAGSSAGAICWFEQCLTDSYADEYTALDCLGILPGSCCPHFNEPTARKKTYHRLVEQGKLRPGIAIDEQVAVHFVGDIVYQVLTTDKKTGAYEVGLQGKKAVQKGLGSKLIRA